ncbi:CDC48 family AAA ATPase [Nitrososphaera viennensis]|uniref:AAA family ATPase, CDC48 subfamily n=2 Tax=Nitrososphaera viennensis TaxID=1034015 RepID=A0A060HGR4_9ARCH|nr:CDC48 family AAA ATPase [Nitrososphaera viennensis]AIC14530.1 AAA family ATPase, CDC48 subfamily [Nitrososphaera viennensis EN76]UVS69503.1 CDC48 family AAA ATPase [Nitrososphaera viennensis]
MKKAKAGSDESPQVQLRVAEAKHRDVGKCRARLDPHYMEQIGVQPGEVIEIIGKRATAVTAWPADDEEQETDIIRIDGQTRKNASVGLNDLLNVRKAESKAAKSITLMPIGDSNITVDKEFCEFVKGRLKGFPVSEGDEISVVILGNSMDFKVQKVSPKAIVRVERPTKLVIMAETAQDRKPRVTYEEIGGMKEQIKRLREIVELPMRHPEVFARLGIEPHSGILMYGPPGTGKTLIAKALASESEANFFIINGPEIMNKYYGETEARLRDIFKEAKESSPSIIFIDEIDAIAPKREEAFGDVEKRVVAQLLALMDGMQERGQVIVLGATNRPESLDPALRRPGRFDREIEIGVPNAEGRLEILQIHTRGMPLDDDIDLQELASELHGYTGADIKALCREAAMKALRRYLPEIDLEGDKISPEVLEQMVITTKDFRDGIKEIVPTAMREFYVEVARVKWTEVGGLYDAKRVLHDNLITSIKEPESFSKMGIKPPKGALLYGPSGTGKTLIAKALATESNANIIIVRGPEVLSKWVGESEKAIREIFRKAKTSSPCIVVFDELDSLARPRGQSEDGAGNERVVSQILTEMDDAGNSGVIIVGITNRPDLIDPSLLRPGRLDLIVYIGQPDEKARFEILKIITQPMPLENDVDLASIAQTTRNFSGADLFALCREAAVSAMQRKSPTISNADFAQALRAARPSITKEVEEWYESMKKSLTYAMPKPIDKSFYG